MVGESRLEMEVEEWSTPHSVFRELCDRAPGLEAIRAGLRCALDEGYANWDDRLYDGSELAFIPPMAGG